MVVVFLAVRTSSEEELLLLLLAGEEDCNEEYGIDYCIDYGRIGYGEQCYRFFVNSVSIVMQTVSHVRILTRLR